MPEYRVKVAPDTDTDTDAYADVENDAPEATAPVLTQSVEDQHLAERVALALRARDFWALHAVRVAVRARVVFLKGRVPSYYMKQLAQVTARAVPGMHQIRNYLDVVQPN